MTFLTHVIRFAVAAIVLLLIGYIVPGFSIFGFWSAVFAALVIAALGWVAEYFFGDRISPYGRGIVGFLVSAVIIYVAQFFVGSMRTTFLGALLAALAIGIVDLFVPVRPIFATGENRGGGRVGGNERPRQN
ncbi:phage holin family protein [Microaerobacter geothermalis]|uniref:phage holin family protein n=1 Tax=Microaerobacter geothermalis TaxID=674972 RepID=UPI001F304FCE|nr:phage holin family protein [Microaerobacter geothermalis]MCF6092552.1 phage holin family protein [Microaerobacter geothermalis]